MRFSFEKLTSLPEYKALSQEEKDKVNAMYIDGKWSDIEGLPGFDRLGKETIDKVRSEFIGQFYDDTLERQGQDLNLTPFAGLPRASDPPPEPDMMRGDQASQEPEMMRGGMAEPTSVHGGLVAPKATPEPPKQATGLLTDPLKRTGIHAASAVNRSLASFTKGLSDMADFVSEKTGLNKGGIFDAALKQYQENAEYWDSKIADTERYLPEEIVGEFLGASGPGIAEFILGVPYAAIQGGLEGGVKGAAKEGAKRALMGQILHYGNQLRIPERTATMATVGGVEAAAAGGDAKEIAKGAGTMGLLGLMAGGGGISGKQAFKNAFEALKQSDFYRKATIKERGLVVQNLEEMMRNNPDMTEGEILRRFPQYRQESFAKRSTGEVVREPKAEPADILKAESVDEAISTFRESVKPPEYPGNENAIDREIAELHNKESILPQAALKAPDVLSSSSGKGDLPSRLEASLETSDGKQDIKKREVGEDTGVVQPGVDIVGGMDKGGEQGVKEKPGDKEAGSTKIEAIQKEQGKVGAQTSQKTEKDLYRKIDQPKNQTDYDTWKENQRKKREDRKKDKKEEATSETISNPESVADGQEVNTNPSEAQKEAENYKKAHVRLDGMDISIENPAGSIRSGKDQTGKEWSTEMKNDYGYIKGSKGYDKDHVDIFIAPGYNGGADKVYVVNQVNKGGKFDEHKAVIGAKSEQEALALYNSNYETGWDGAKSVVPMPVGEFKEWVTSNEPAKGELAAHKPTTKPVDAQKTGDVSDKQKGEWVKLDKGLNQYRVEGATYGSVTDTKLSYGNNSAIRFEAGDGERFETMREAKAYEISRINKELPPDKEAPAGDQETTDSKVSPDVGDATQKPKKAKTNTTIEKLYHGSRSQKIDGAIKTTESGDYGKGVYLTNDLKFASSFTDLQNFGKSWSEIKSGPKGKVFEVKINIQGGKIFGGSKKLTKEEIKHWESDGEMMDDVVTHDDLMDTATARNQPGGSWSISQAWDSFLEKFNYVAVNDGVQVMVRNPDNVEVVGSVGAEKPEIEPKKVKQVAKPGTKKLEKIFLRQEVVVKETGEKAIIVERADKALEHTDRVIEKYYLIRECLKT